jgi:hypothetical protein
MNEAAADKAVIAFKGPDIAPSKDVALLIKRSKPEYKPSSKCSLCLRAVFKKAVPDERAVWSVYVAKVRIYELLSFEVWMSNHRWWGLASYEVSETMVESTGAI